MNRVEVSNAFCNLCTMQVCAVSDATDEEILKVCNEENPSGTSAGWTKVIREVKDDEISIFVNKSCEPVQCADHAHRLHFLVLC